MQLGYAVYSGDDVANPRLARPRRRAASCRSLGHAAGDQIRAMVDAFFAGDPPGALAIFTRLLPAIDAVMGVANYGATTAKAALQLLGVLDNRNVRGAARAPGRRRGGRAARGPRRVRPALTIQELDVSHPHPELSAPGRAGRRGACGSSRSAASARSAAT